MTACPLKQSPNDKALLEEAARLNFAQFTQFFHANRRALMRILPTKFHSGKTYGGSKYSIQFIRDMYDFIRGCYGHANVVHPHSRSHSSNRSTLISYSSSISLSDPSHSPPYFTRIMQAITKTINNEDDTTYAEGYLNVDHFKISRLTRLYEHLNSNFPANLNASFMVENDFGRLDESLPIVFAASYGYADIVIELLNAGVDINYSIIHVRTALEAAAAHKQFKMVRLLLNKGADPNVRSLFVEVDGVIADAPSALIVASDGNDVRIVRLLLKHGADPNATWNRNKDHTALMKAAQIDSIEIVEVLLKHGANPNAALDDGLTALMEAVESNTAEAPPVVELLLKHGANPDAICNGKTVLARARSSDAVIMLLNAGCSIPSYDDDPTGTHALCRLLDSSRGIKVKFSGKTLTNIVRVGKGYGGILHSYLNAFLRAKKAQLEEAGEADKADIKNLRKSNLHLGSEVAKLLLDRFNNERNKNMRRMATFIKRVETILNTEDDISTSSKSVSDNIQPDFKTIADFKIKFKRMTDTYFRKAFPEFF